MHHHQVAFRYAALALALLAARPAIAAERTYSAARFAVDIEGQRQLVHSIEGGSAVGIVVANGTDKRINGVRYEDIIFTMQPTALPKPVVDAINGKGTTLNGGIDYLDFDFKGQRRVAFQNATVSAIRLPALDGSSKDVALVEVALAPQQTREDTPGGDLKSVGSAAKQKSAMRSAFRVILPGLPAERVATVSAIEVRAKRSEGAGVGTERAPSKAPELEIPNIKLTMSAVDVKPWQQWLDKTLSETGSSQEKTMRVELLDPSMKNAMASVDLSGVGIVAIRTPKTEANSEAIQRVEIELFAEQLKFNGGPDAGGGTKSAAAAPSDAAQAEPAKSEPVPDRPVRRAR